MRWLLVVLLALTLARADVAPDFALPLADGGRMRLSSLRGEPVVLTFWAFWCTTWQEVNRGYRELRSRHVPARLVVVAVDPTRAELLHDPEHGFDRFFPILIDQHREVSRRYQVDCVPTVLVLDSAGAIRYRHRGWPGTAALESAVKQSLVQEAGLALGKTAIPWMRRRKPQ